MGWRFECKTWNQRLLKVNVGVKLLDIGLDDFLKFDPKSNKNKQVELHQSKKFLQSKGNLPKMQPTEWEKILANLVSDKGVNIQNIFKNPYNSICVCVCVCVRTRVLVAQSCPTLRPDGLEPTRLLCPWDSPGKNTGVGCHFLLQKGWWKNVKSRW